MAIVKRSISITEQQDQWIKSKISSGEFGNESEVYRDLLRRAQEQEEKLALVRAAVSEGERDFEQGRYTSFETKEDMAAFFNQIKQAARDSLS